MKVNRKAKSIVKEAFREEGLPWGVCEEGDWDVCRKYHYFDGLRSVADFMYMVGAGRYVKDEKRWSEMMSRWGKVELSWWKEK